MTFLFKAKNGIPDFGSPHNQARFHQHLKEKEGKIFRIVEEIHTRTLSQNKLYHMFLNVIEMETGQPAEDVHEWAKRKFLPPRTININGEMIRICGTTTSLNKIKFSEYMEMISKKVGVAIPDTEAYLREIDLAPLR